MRVEEEFGFKVNECEEGSGAVRVLWGGVLYKLVLSSHICTSARLMLS